MKSWLTNPSKPLLVDGGMGTALSARGLDPAIEVTSTWNLKHPTRVQAVHEGFVSAGAELIHANTFSANRWQLRNQPEQLTENNREGVMLARRVATANTANTNVWVAGDLGPSGDLPPPEGDADLFDLEDGFECQARLLIVAGVDALHIETLYHPKEARAAIRGCRRASADIPIIASMACRRLGQGFVTVAGLPWRAMLKAFIEEGANAVGANCSLSPLEMLPLIEQIRYRTQLPIFAQPTVAPTGGAPLYPGEFALGLVKLVRAGANAVGGCCGTSAADIAAARVALDAVPWPRASQPTRPFASAASAAISAEAPEPCY